VIRRQRPVNWLVAQVADRAGRFSRAAVMMQHHASERHADQQQRKQRHRNR